MSTYTLKDSTPLPNPKALPLMKALDKLYALLTKKAYKVKMRYVK